MRLLPLLVMVLWVLTLISVTFASRSLTTPPLPHSLFTSLHFTRHTHESARTHRNTCTRSKVWSNYTKLRHQREETSISFPPQNSHQQHSRPASDDTTPQNSPHTVVNFSHTVDQTPNQHPNDEFVSKPRMNHYSLNWSQWYLYWLVRANFAI